MRVTLKGINSIRKKLADGTYKTYWYAWKVGPPLQGEQGSPEFHASYNEAGRPQGYFAAARQTLERVADYSDSEDFRGLAASTRRSYIALIKLIEKAFGDFPLAA
jgi:hypothetical protein